MLSKPIKLKPNKKQLDSKSGLSQPVCSGGMFGCDSRENTSGIVRAFKRFSIFAEELPAWWCFKPWCTVANANYKHNIMQTTHWTQYTAHCTLHPACDKLHTKHCTLHNARCTLHTAYYILQTTLHTTQCTLHTSHCILHTTHCTLHTALKSFLKPTL